MRVKLVNRYHDTESFAYVGEGMLDRNREVAYLTHDQWRRHKKYLCLRNDSCVCFGQFTFALVNGQPFNIEKEYTQD